MIKYFKNIYAVSKALVEGLAVTLVWLFKPALTVQYPDQKIKLAERFRGTLAYDKETCTACGLCVKACPSNCISLEAAIDTASKKRVAKAAWYQIDYGKCNYCRLCEESCPTKPKSVRHTREYEWAVDDRRKLLVKWAREQR